jgi:carbonic anhydrase
MNKTKNIGIGLIIFLTTLNPYAFAKDEHKAPEGVTADKAMETLKEGNARFVSGKATHPNQDSARIKELAGGQKPHTIVLSCSDSRVPPEMLFDQGLGDIFTVRTAGETLGANAIGSIEYAVEHLGAKLIVVMGHTSCGAVKAALSLGDKSTGSPNLDTLVGSIQKKLKTYRAPAGEDKLLLAPVKLNVNEVVQELQSRSKLIRDAMHDHGLKIVPGVYNLDSGKVDFWN